MTFSQCFTKIGDKNIFALGLVGGIYDFTEVITHTESWIAEMFEHKFAVGTFSNPGCTE